jgi:molybdopterin synthase catalytic subunit
MPVPNEATGTGTIVIDVRVFARYAELLDRNHITLEVPHGSTVADAIGAVVAHVPGGARLAGVALAAVNRRHVARATVLADGDELALLPPLAGG